MNYIMLCKNGKSAFATENGQLLAFADKGIAEAQVFWMKFNDAELNDFNCAVVKGGNAAAPK